MAIQYIFIFSHLECFSNNFKKCIYKWRSHLKYFWIKIFIDWLCINMHTIVTVCVCGSHSNSGYLVSPSTFTWVLRINLMWSVLRLGMQVLLHTQSLCRLPRSFFFRQLLMHPRLCTSLQWGHCWLWTPDSPFFTHPVLGVRACTAMLLSFWVTGRHSTYSVLRPSKAPSHTQPLSLTFFSIFPFTWFEGDTAGKS